MKPVIAIAGVAMPAYDPDGFTQPWIGRVVKWDNPNEFPLLHHGAFIRDEARRRGSSGRLEIPVSVEGVVLFGMRGRTPNPSTQSEAVVCADGTLEQVTWSEAWEQWRDIAQYLPRELPPGPWVQLAHHTQEA